MAEDAVVVVTITAIAIVNLDVFVEKLMTKTVSPIFGALFLIYGINDFLKSSRF
ncbi:hypothetical protein [Pseudogracilibacillus auburnensis]|uniref:hypothetical protein n=1 Tax=Pseudogracilibacillus auburnensis TaxID=1494959 RepID=UPI001B87B07B|nr:hypothetical protein [Pseudogracilibacillus auburnensis]